MRRQPKSLLLAWWPVNIYCTASQNGAIPHIYPSIEATSKACLLMLLVAVFLFLLRKRQNGGAKRRNMLLMDPVWDSFFCFTLERYGFRTRTKVTRVGSATEMKSDWSELILRPVPCKRMPEKKCMETDINSYRSEFVPVGRRSWQVVSEAKNAVSVAVSKLTLPWVKLNWNCRE